MSGASDAMRTRVLMDAGAAPTAIGRGPMESAPVAGWRRAWGEARPGGLSEAAEPLAFTKLVPPRLDEHLVSRPRLLDLLNRGAGHPVTIVSGGAGAGKTLAVASWAELGRRPGPVAWVSLDPDDNDPARFWSHVLAALRSTGTIPADNPLTDLVPLQPPSEAFYLRLAGGLAQLLQPVVVVLDDLHQVTAQPVLQRLAALLRHPAPALRLVLLTRVDPELPLARLRLDGQLTESAAATWRSRHRKRKPCSAGPG